MEKFRKTHTSPRIVPRCLVLMIVALLLGATTGGLSAEQALGPQHGMQENPGEPPAGTERSGVDSILEGQGKLAANLNKVETMIQKIGTVQAEMEDGLWRAETRTSTNKRQGKTAVQLLVAVVLTLALIAVGFPGLFIWYNSRRLKRMTAISSEIAGTLVLVQERQARLGDTLREMQDELDYIPVSSAPDFAKLLKEAEQSLNEASRKLDTINGTIKPDK